jgi:hypothetical protein
MTKGNFTTLEPDPLLDFMEARENAHYINMLLDRLDQLYPPGMDVAVDKALKEVFAKGTLPK